MPEPDNVTDGEEQAQSKPEGEQPPQQSRRRQAAITQFPSSHNQRSEDDDEKGVNWLARTTSVIVVAAGIYALYAAGAFDKPERIIVFLTSILAIVGMLQWWTYHRQWLVMRDQHDAMERQLKLAEGQLNAAQKAIDQTQITIDRTAIDSRAWIAIEKPFIRDESGIILDIRANDPFWLVVPLHNYGRTPAYLIGHAAQFDVCDREDDIPLLVQRTIESAKADPHESVIAPANAVNGNCKMQQLSDAELARIKSGKISLLGTGVAIYRDVYGGLHQTRYVLEWDTTRKAFGQYKKYQHMD